MVFSKSCQRFCPAPAQYHVHAGKLETSCCGRHLTRTIEMVLRLEKESGRPVDSVTVTPVRGAGRG